MRSGFWKVLCLVVILSIVQTTCYAAKAHVYVSWSNPTTRSDGTSLTNLAKVRIYWTYNCTQTYTAGQVILQSLDIITTTPGASLGTWVTITGPAPFCFTLTAIDSAGLESIPSPVVIWPILRPGTAIRLH